MIGAISYVGDMSVIASEIYRGTILLSIPYREQIFTPSINISTGIILANYLSNGHNTNTTTDLNISATKAGSIAEDVWEMYSYRRHKASFLSPYDNVIVATNKPG